MTNKGTDATPGLSLEGFSELELYQSGSLHFRNRDYDSARACFEGYLERNPADAAAFHLLAKVYFHQNRDLEKAEECLKKALELDHSALTRYLETLGMIYISQGRFKRAEEVFEYALSEDKKDDKRHTHSLEFHLDLARKKKVWSKRRHTEQSTAPEFQVTDLYWWRTKSRQSLFLLPSILLHAAVLILAGYLSTHSLPIKLGKEDFTFLDKEDFSYVEIRKESAGAAGETLMAKAMPGDKGSQVKPQLVAGEKSMDFTRKEKRLAMEEAGLTARRLGIGPGPSSAVEAGAAGGKVSGSLEYAASAEKISPAAGGERRVDLPGSAGRRFASAEATPLIRGLDIQTPGRPGAAAPAGARENIASLDRRGSAGSAGMGVAGLSEGRPGAEGYKAGVAAGKGVNSKALGGQPEGEGAGLSGLPEKTAKRVSDAIGIGGGGVRLGSGEGAAQPGTARTAAPVASLQARAGTGGGKKMTEGALGEPGSETGRYASLGNGMRPGGIEKRSGVGRGPALAKDTPGPSVSITSPTSGRTNRLTQVVTGAISDTRIRKATLTVNNDSRVISVENGRFESTVSLGKGRNTITVMALDLDGNKDKAIVVLDYAEPSEGASITIASPRQGQVFDVSERGIISVKGTIGDPEIKKAKLIFNGNPMDIVVNRGFFDQKVTLAKERNTILVEAVTPDGVASRSRLITVNTMNVKPKDVVLILTWDKPHADFDLHVYGPMGGHTYYKNPNIYESKDAIAGGQLEQDAKGNFGPEVYTQDRADRGVYTVKSNYYYSGGDGDAHATLTVILYGDDPSRRIVRVFGPHPQADTKDGSDWWEVTRFKMPEGIFLEDQ